MNDLIIFNGETVPAHAAIVTAGNRGFRYGDGLFETIKIKDGQIVLGHYHFDRLFHGCGLLGFPHNFLAEKLQEQILELCELNGHSALARVRLTVFRGEGGLYDLAGLQPGYCIESWPLPASAPALNETGLIVDVFPDGVKSCDRFSNLKSANYLVYVMAAMYAREHGWQDAFVLNQHGRIADSTIANLFYCKGGAVFTPPLSEGCVAGVMRRHLLNLLPLQGLPVYERPTGLADLEGADEIWLTNALRGLQWVGAFRGARFERRIAESVYGHL